MSKNARVLSKNEQKCALFEYFFAPPLRVWCYVDNLYLVFRRSSEEFFRCRLTQINADLFGHKKAQKSQKKLDADYADCAEKYS